MKRFVAILSLALFASTAKAVELSETWVSVRALAMGNAYSAIVDDADALFYNPAGLGKVNGFNWTVFDIHGGFNGAETLESIQSLTDMSDVATSVNKLYGKQVFASAGGKSAITLPGFGLAFYGSGNAGAYMQNPAYPTMNLNYFFDYGFAVGGAVDFVPGFFKVGIVGRRINRTGTTLPIGPSTLATLDTATLESELKRRGTGYGLDVGALITVPGPVRPSISFVYKNVGQIYFTHEEGAGAPPPVDSEMVIGAALEIDSMIITLRPVIDYRWANRADLQLGQKLHLGLEIDLPLIDLRAGFNQGYYTAGVGLSLGILRADVATYGVELGEYPGQKEDRRYMAQITFELGFDPAKFSLGGFGGKSGEGRRLKQRR